MKPRTTRVIGDGICDDHLNTANCDYDGGDCCLPYIVDMCDSQIYSCICHEDGLIHPTFYGNFICSTCFQTACTFKV